MAGQGDAHGFGQQGRHRDALAFHLFVEGVELVGADRVADVETGDRQAGVHVAHHRLLQGVEGDGFAGSPEALADRGAGGGFGGRSMG